jgi:hypothetical protein
MSLRIHPPAFGPLLAQFRAGDEALPAYQIVCGRVASQARAAGVERAYVFDPALGTRLDTGSKPPGSVRRLPERRRQTFLRAIGAPGSQR